MPAWKPWFQPPRQVFPIVWPILYADIAAVSASTVDQLEDQRRSGKGPRLHPALAINLVLNGSWTWLFFNAASSARLRWRPRR